MFRVALIVFALAVLSVSPPAGLLGQDQKSAKVDITGTWRAEGEVAGQTAEPVFTLKQDGDMITGKYQGSFGEFDVTGNVTANTVEFEFDTGMGMVIYTGTVDKDSMKGEAKYGDATESFTAKWEKAKDEPKAATGSSPSTSVEKTTFQYATRDSQKLLLDMIVDPSFKAAGKRPVIIFMFGGGWEGGGRDDQGIVPGLNQLASRGYTVVSIDYRLGIKIAKTKKEMTRDNGTEMYLRAIEWSVEDLFDATSYIVERADEWNIDKDQIVLLGGSSGATNSLVAEFNVANDTELARVHLPKGFRYAGIISMAGAFWLKAKTPLTFKSTPAPIMFFHGAKDQLVTYDEHQGEFSGYGPVYYLRKFPSPDFPKWFVDYPEGDHIVAATPFADCQLEIAAFLQKMVKERQKASIHMVVDEKTPKTFENLLKAISAQSSKYEEAPARK